MRNRRTQTGIGEREKKETGEIIKKVVELNKKKVGTEEIGIRNVYR